MLHTNDGDPTNESRAAWAREAVGRYAELTRHDAAYVDDIDGLTEAAQDLVGDILHMLCLNDVPLGSLLAAAFSCFAEERDEEGESVPEPIEALQAICEAPGAVGES